MAVIGIIKTENNVMDVKGFKKSLLVLSLISLFSCGSDDINETKEDIEDSLGESAVAYNKLATAPLNTPVSIDLTSHVKGDDILIQSISTTQTDSCYGFVDGMQSVNVEIAKLGRCDYTYIVEDASGASVAANLTLVSSTQADPSLPAVSYNTTKQESNPTINLQSLLIDANVAEINLEGYAIESAKVVQSSDKICDPDDADNQSDCINITSIETTALILTLSTPSSIGWHKIHYTLNNATTNEAQIGEIFISVAEASNQPPEINNPKYFYTSNGATKEENEFTLEVDLSQIDVDCAENGMAVGILIQRCFGISDSSGANNWTLAEVNAMEAKVELKNETLFNTGFTFSTTVEGFHDVNYLISDYEGATSLGKIRIFAYEDLIISDNLWLDIAYDDDDFEDQDFDGKYRKYCSAVVQRDDFTCATAPLTHAKANSEHGNPEYHPEYIGLNVDSTSGLGDGYYAVSKWTFSQAKALCEALNDSLPMKKETKLELPTQDELKEIANYAVGEKLITDSGFVKWPTALPYFTEDGDLYDLISKELKKANPDDFGYVTCFEEEEDDDD